VLAKPAEVNAHTYNQALPCGMLDHLLMKLKPDFVEPDKSQSEVVASGHQELKFVEAFNCPQLRHASIRCPGRNPKIEWIFVTRPDSSIQGARQRSSIYLT
jgi:hypothetical protein